jgi:crossover junction endodeoxyribonuclease RusA
MSEPIQIELAYPPSLNTYWRHVPMNGGVRVLISAEGRAYRANVASRAYLVRPRPIVGLLDIDMYAFPPDRRERDGDNLPKAVFDSLVKAGVLQGDSNRYIKRHSIEWQEPTKHSRFVLFIRRFE